MKNYFDTEKRYSEMPRNQKRAYKRWLSKNRMWDGEVVIENQKKMKRLFYRE